MEQQIKPDQRKYNYAKQVRYKHITLKLMCLKKFSMSLLIILFHTWSILDTQSIYSQCYNYMHHHFDVDHYNLLICVITSRVVQEESVGIVLCAVR